jgi:N-acetylneuraminate synthase
MCSLDNIDRAVEIFRDADCSFELMHCISTYPMENKNANLNVIHTLKNRYNCDVGYSGHEAGLAVSYGAAAMGISSLERHITMGRAMYGSDQSASIEPTGFKMLVASVRIIDNAMGDGIKSILEAEIPIAENLRQHLDG